MTSSTPRQRLLDAAARLVARDGVAKLTLGAVAKEAALSKGGLLYHFPSKEKLIAALVEALVSDFDLSCATRMTRDQTAKGRFARAYLHTATAKDVGQTDAVAAGVLSAVANDLSLLAPLHEGYHRWQKQLEVDGIDRVVATVIRLAVDGLWFASIVGLPPLAPRLRRGVIKFLEQLTTAGARP